MVLLVVAMLAIGAYSFTQLMIVEAEGAKSYGRMVQARQAAESGVHYVAAILADQRLNESLGTDMFDAPGMLHGQVVNDEAAAQPRLRCRFSVVAPNEGGQIGGGVRYGVTDEAGKLNPNALVQWLEDRKKQASQPSGGGTGTAGAASTGTASTDSSSTNPLLNLPYMTPEIADAILDWIDADDEPRDSGCESEYYQSLDLPYLAKNGPLTSLDELLVVRGVTPRLLYGEDANRNGILDPNEDDGELSYPSDDGNGMLERGWIQYLTLHSRESNTDATGQRRINLNNKDLESLFGELSQDPDFGEEQATFIVAYRLFGPTQSGQSGSSSASGAASSRSSGSPSSDTTGSGGSQGSGETQSSKTIAGMDASGGAKQSIASVVDLIGVSVNAKVQGKNTELKSPFQAEDMSDYLDTLLDRTTTSESKNFAGRVNVNSAPVAVLMGVPGMTEELADLIVASQPQAAAPASDVSSAGVAWLLTSETFSKEQFKTYEKYITGRGQVFSVQVVGYFDEGGPMARVEAVIDVSGPSPRIRRLDDLTPLGRGYDLRTLMMSP